MNIVSLFYNIKNTAGTNAKKQMLADNMNDLVKDIFEMAYGEHKYFIKKISPDEIVAHPKADGAYITIEEGWEDFKQVLHQCECRHITGHEAKAALVAELGRFWAEDEEILINVLQHNLKIGISADNFYAVIGKPVDKHEVSLAENLKNAKGVDPICGSYFASRKLDGCVDYYSNIEFEDGRIIPIGEVVEKRITGRVKSFDGENIVYEEISDHWMGDDPTKNWVEIELENGKIIKITDNDRLMTDSGWKYVKDLTEKDKILTDEV